MKHRELLHENNYALEFRMLLLIQNQQVLVLLSLKVENNYY